ncbi:glutaredoxin family protein [Aestuariirhabdus litorea]|uniref:Glutaredoxin n=1 Tax=Aestuariirhabdus litorea TaxID=2528527 RepID=A0A3P3VKK7_9GAMM|nr:glutaredoxin [Aestuariirhabdus litorea]RRJ83265.1 glutaredoxin [Aestuariirhabdus litorea]RWW93424.1 glutaredoxin [Endozoicomonadaceae bacterium GTF-13]
MFLIRFILGRIILTLDFIFTPRSPRRPEDQQQVLDQQTAKLALYQFQACPFCVKVRRAIKRQGLNIETRDARNNPLHRAELESEGGQVKVPCLRIETELGEVRWMYESSEIIHYLQQRFA